MSDIDFILDEEKKRRDRSLSEGVDATRILKKLLNSSPEVQDKAMAAVMKGFEKGGRELLGRAIDEGITTLEEWKSHGLNESDASPVLMAYYSKIDGHSPAEEEVYVLTVQDSQIWKEQAWLKTKFQVDCILPEDALGKLSKPSQAKNTPLLPLELKLKNQENPGTPTPQETKVQCAGQANTCKKPATQELQPHPNILYLLKVTPDHWMPLCQDCTERYKKDWHTKLPQVPWQEAIQIRKLSTNNR